MLVGPRKSRSAHIGLAAYLFSHQISLPNNPRRPFAVLPCRKGALGDEAADCGGADSKDCSRLIDCCLAAIGVLALTIDGDVVLMPKRANTPPCPAVSPTRRLAGSVKQRGDCLVWHLSRQSTDQINHLHVGGPSCLAGTVALHHEAGVVVALPMHDKLEILADDIDDDLEYAGTNDLFARLWRRAGTLPRSHQVLTERHKLLAVGDGQGWRRVGVKATDLAFKIAHGYQALIPSSSPVSCRPLRAAIASSCSTWSCSTAFARSIAPSLMACDGSSNRSRCALAPCLVIGLFPEDLLPRATG